MSLTYFWWNTKSGRGCTAVERIWTTIPHAALSMNVSMSAGATDLGMFISECPRTEWMRSHMAFAWGFLILVDLRFMPYESHNVSKCNLNSDPLSYIKWRHHGYLRNQILLTNLAVWVDDLSKISSSLTFSLPLTFMVVSHSTSGNSTISNQLEAVLIMVSATKSIAEPSLPLRVYGPTRLTHNTVHGVLITILDGRWPYFSVRFFDLAWLTWFCYGLDCSLHSIWIYHSTHRLFKMGVPRVLEIAVVPHRCSPLQRLGYAQPSFVTDAFLILDHSKF